MQHSNRYLVFGSLMALLVLAETAIAKPNCEEIAPTGSIAGVGSYVTATVGKNFAFRPNQCMYSPGRNFVVWNQGDGVFALYPAENTCMGCARSQIGAGNPSEKTWTMLQSDGHLVTYPERLVRQGNGSWHGTDSPQTSAWPLTTAGLDSYFFLIGDDATFSIYRGDSPRTFRGLIAADRPTTTLTLCVSIRTIDDTPLSSKTLKAPDRVFAFASGYEFAAEWNNKPRTVKDRAEKVVVMDWSITCGP